LRAVHSHLAAESVSLGQTNKALEQLLCLLQMEAVDLRGVLAREIAALSAQFVQKAADLREQFTEDIAKTVQKQAKSGDGATDVMKSNFSASQSSPRTLFSFTSARVNKGKCQRAGSFRT
jgi:DNA-directed RNA polymerase specialized sigma54-like protein